MTWRCSQQRVAGKNVPAPVAGASWLCSSRGVGSRSGPLVKGFLFSDAFVSFRPRRLHVNGADLSLVFFFSKNL